MTPHKIIDESEEVIEFNYRKPRIVPKDEIILPFQPSRRDRRSMWTPTKIKVVDLTPDMISRLFPDLP